MDERPLTVEGAKNLLRYIRSIIIQAREYLAVDSIPDMLLESAEIALNETIGDDEDDDDDERTHIEPA